MGVGLCPQLRYQISGHWPRGSSFAELGKLRDLERDPPKPLIPISLPAAAQMGIPDWPAHVIPKPYWTFRLKH